MEALVTFDFGQSNSALVMGEGTAQNLKKKTKLKTTLISPIWL